MRVLFAVLCLIFVSASAEAQKNLVVVLDPGHGGTDPGSSRIFSGARVTEDEYVYDVSLRVKRLLRERKTPVFMTVSGDTRARNLSPSSIFPDDRSERFSGSKLVARAGSRGLKQRLEYGNAVHRRYPKHRTVWISIHFDVVGTREDVDGVRVIYGGNSLGLAKALEKSFARSGRMREHGPVAESGDDRYGLRNLFVLGRANQADAKVLIELGNFNNSHDLWRIRDPKVRESYARAIVRGLANY